jgi:uncharacterized protein involved in outer membrane biogenesis
MLYELYPNHLIEVQNIDASLSPKKLLAKRIKMSKTLFKYGTIMVKNYKNIIPTVGIH